jgi:hypothetical protein
MKILVAKLMKEVNEKLAKIEKDVADIIKKSLESALVFKDALKELKDFMLSYTFKDQNEEIWFFKETKPWFDHQLIYHIGIYHIELGRPQGLMSDQKKYLHEHIESIDRENNKYLSFNAYCHSGATLFDDKFFVRGVNESIQYPESFSHELDPRFSTHFDHIVAKVQANNLMLSYLKTEEEMLDTQKALFLNLPKARLTWLETKTALKELIHGLYCMKVFGQVTMAELTKYFETIFNIDLGQNMSRSLCDMRDRTDQVPFLDKLRNALLERMTSGKKTKTKTKNQTKNQTKR